MYRSLRRVLVAILVTSTSVHGQTPSEVQKWRGAQGAVGPNANDLFDGIAVRGNPGYAFQGGDYARWGRLESGVWQQMAGDITGDNGNGSILFSYSIAVEGDLLFAGAPLDDPNGVDRAGSVFVFILDQQTNEWIQVQKIFASDGAVNDQFGLAIGMDGDTLAVGAAGRGEPSHGGVYIFELIDGVWTETQFLRPGNLTEDDRGFGGAIAIDGNRLVVGATGYDGSGRAFVYERDENGLWQETAILSGLRYEDEDFGDAVDVLGNLIVVGAPYSYEEEERGDFRVFRYDGSTWNVEWRWYQEHNVLDGVGKSVAILDSRDVILVGARDAQFFKSGFGDGSIRIFEYDPDVQEWFETSLFSPTDQAQQYEQAFAWSMALDGDWLMVGAPGDDGGSGNNDGGAAYFFDLTGQLGTRSELIDASAQYGTLLAGSVSSLKNSEDSRLHIRSRFNFTGTDSMIADLRIGAQNNIANPQTINLLIEGRLTQSGGTMKVRLRNWTTNAFNQVRQYSIGAVEDVEPVSDIPAANYIRASDDRIEVSLRASALVTFSTLGFEEQIDFVNVLVHD